VARIRGIKKERESNYGIIDYIRDNISNDDLKSIDKVKEAILKHAKTSDDGGQKVKDYFKFDPNLEKQSKKKGTKIQPEINTTNEAYIKTTTKDINEKELPELKEFKVDLEYEEETITELITIQEERIDELESQSIKAKREFGRESRARIQAIKDVDEFLDVGEELQARGEEIGILKPRSVFGVELDRKRDELLEKARTEQ